MGSPEMRFELTSAPWDTLSADALVIPVWKPAEAVGESKPASGKKNAKADKALAFALPPALAGLNQALQGMMASAAVDEKFTGAHGSLLTFRKTPGDSLAARRVTLVGLGDPRKATLGKLESALGKAIGAVIDLKDLETLAVGVPAIADGMAFTTAQALAQAVDAVFGATYRSQEAKEAGPAPKAVLLRLEAKATSADKQALAEGLALARARARVKDLVNRPSNLKSTQTLVEEALALAKLPGVTTTIQADPAWIEKEMPCFFEVARGSLASDPPKWIRVAYQPGSSTAKGKKAATPAPELALIGKSVIFDTGGYQVKPGNGMCTMKGDMTGGASVLAAIGALAELKAPMAVTAWLAATPNKIDSNAMIPDAIVPTACGKKVEIRHTDAEGRLTLIDAVTVAEREKPTAMVTIATLTGSASQAVGVRMALMSNDAALGAQVARAAAAVGDPCQTLDVDEADFDDIKSKLDGADIRNTQKTTGRGAQTAAAFVMSGLSDERPLAHLDIAGADMTSDEKATGIGVKTLVRLALDWSANDAR